MNECLSANKVWEDGICYVIKESFSTNKAGLSSMEIPINVMAGQELFFEYAASRCDLEIFIDDKSIFLQIAGYFRDGREKIILKESGNKIFKIVGECGESGYIDLGNIQIK